MRHCVKSVEIRSFFWSVFSCIRTEYGVYSVNLRIQSKYRKIRTRKISVFGHFSRCEIILEKVFQVMRRDIHSSELPFVYRKEAVSSSQNIATRNNINLETCLRLLFMLLQDIFASARLHRVHKIYFYRSVQGIICAT